MKIIDENYVLGNYNFFLCYYSFPLRIAQAVANSNEVSMQCQCKVCCKVIPALIMDEGGETAGGGRSPQPNPHTGGTASASRLNQHPW